MMRSRVISALIIVVVLIGGAFSLRIQINKPEAKLALAEGDNLNNKLEGGDQNVATSTDLTVPAEATPSKPLSLSDSDLISRQLFGDFFGLLSVGAATPENISTLTDNYSKNISDLNKATLLMLTDLKVVGDTKASLTAYAEAFSSIFYDYQTQMQTVVSSGDDAAELGPRFLAAMKKLGSLYQKEADALALINVPRSVALDHLDLINTYRSAAVALANLANIDKDPLSAYAGLLIEQKALQQEAITLPRIAQTLKNSGIISSSP